MNYIKIYYDIINKAKLRGLNKKKLEGYFEKHHIIPACYFKSRNIATYNENLVLLTAKEHFICHQLLWKNDKINSSLFLAFHKMTFSKGKTKRPVRVLTSKQFELVRKALHEANVKGITGFGKARKNNPEFFAKMGKDNMTKTWQDASFKERMLPKQIENINKWNQTERCKELQKGVGQRNRHLLIEYNKNLIPKICDICGRSLKGIPQFNSHYKACKRNCNKNNKAN